MAAPLLTLKDIHLTFGGTPLLTGAELAVEPGDRICLVGRNGSGKSTLLKVAAGAIEPDTGERFVHPNASIRYLAQEVDFAGHPTVLSFVTSGLGPADDPYIATYLLSELGLTGEEDPARLSGGEARRAALAQVLAPKPDILLLDEPTNHLDLPAIEWLESQIGALRSAIVLISHDRRFLENLSRTTAWLDRGVVRRIDKSFAHFEAWRDEFLAQEELERHKLDRKIVRENEWMHGGVTARRKRNVRRVRELQALRQERAEQRKSVGNVKLAAAEGGLSGRLVIEANDISKSFDGVPIVHGLSARVLRQDRIGIVGPNGAGKTTLLKMLTGELEPDSGAVRLGTNLEMVALDQKRDELDPRWTLADALTGGRGDQVVINGKARHVASYMKDFLFLPEQRLTPVSVLSGGERARLMLARALAKPSNLLVLDEPTNDLDLETLDLLEELLADYAGTTLLVSHDRSFLDRVVTSVIASEGDGTWVQYSGGYSDMLAQRKGADLRLSNRTTAAKPRAETTAESSPAPPPAKQKRKLSFKEKHALETLPAKIDTLHAEIAKLQEQIGASDFSADPAGLTAIAQRLAKAEEELSASETQWLELEMLREELGG
jgi:ATP-binding cassette subfamily F protein uup